MTIKTLDKVAICHVDCQIWSGRKKLNEDDLTQVNQQQLPSKEVASLGSKKICDPDVLRQFMQSRRAAKTVCERVGIRFLSGYAIPVSRIDEVTRQLDDIAVRFKTKKSQFLAQYDDVIRSWINKHPDFSDAIRRAVVPVADVARKLHFDYAVYQVKPGPDERQLQNKVDGMGQTLFREVSRDAADLFAKSITGEPKVSQRAVTSLKQLRHKLDGLAFLDRRVQPVVSAMDDLFQRLPLKGAVEGSLYHEITAMVLMMADESKLQQFGEGKLSLSDSDWLPQSVASVMPATTARVHLSPPVSVVATPDIQSSTAPEPLSDQPGGSSFYF